VKNELSGTYAAGLLKTVFQLNAADPAHFHSCSFASIGGSHDFSLQ